MSNLFIHILILLLSVCIASFSQLLLKKEALKEHKSFILQYLNIRVISAYFLLFLSTLCSLVAFRVVPLGLSPFAEAVSQILTVSLSVLFLKEGMTKKKLLGLAIIVIGIILISI